MALPSQKLSPGFLPCPPAEPAPGPDDINWEGLWAGWAERSRRIFTMGLCFILILAFPIGPLTGILANLSIAVCGGSTSSK